MSPYLIKSHGISSDVPNRIEFHHSSPNLKGSYKISLNLTKSHRMSLNLIKSCQISPYLTESHKISPYLIKSHRISSNVPNLNKFHHSSPNLTESYTISLYLTESHQVSPYGTDSYQISAYLTKIKCQDRTSCRTIMGGTCFFRRKKKRYLILPMAFKFSDIMTMDKAVNWLTFRDYGSIFKATGFQYVSKLTLFTWYFLQVFANGFQILRYFLWFCADGFQINTLYKHRQDL